MNTTFEQAQTDYLKAKAELAKTLLLDRVVDASTHAAAVQERTQIFVNLAYVYENAKCNHGHTS